MRRHTISMPTNKLLRSHKTSSLMGVAVFLLFLFVVGLLFVGIFSTLKATIPDWIRNILIGMQVCFIFVVVTCVFILDCLTCINDNLAETAEQSAKMEENIHNLYVMTAKSAKIDKKKHEPPKGWG